MVKPIKQQEVSDEEITRLRDAVLKWVDAKKNAEAKPVDRPPVRKAVINIEKPIPKPVQVTQVKKKKTRKIPWVGIMVVITAIIVGLVVIAISGMLFMHWDNPVVRSVTRMVPIPAATVNVSIVSYYDWITQVQSLKAYYAHNLIDEQPAPTDSKIEQYVLNRLIEQQLVKALAKRYTVSVTPDEINKQVESLVTEVGSLDALSAQVKDLYNWNIDEFKQVVIEPLLLRNKLGLALTLDDRLNYNARVRADELLEQIKTGENSFEFIASRYSQDVSAVQGGDLGYFRPSDMVPEFNQAVMALEPGQISGVVKTRFGYHIIKLIEVLKSDDGNDTQVRAKHILIRSKGLDEYIDQIRDQSYIKHFVVIK